jgi:glutathione S-transferase
MLVGFSRGAYTARALGGMIVRMGLLPWRAMIGNDGSYDPELAYRLGIHVWARYREQAGKQSTLLGYLTEFLGRPIALDQLVPDIPLDCVAVWDTVGSLGIPLQGGPDDQRIDIFQFADRALSPQVAAGFHAVALDEQRSDFVPTLWDARDGVVQRWFCGAHSDVGGGSAAPEYSAIALRWMTAKLASRGVRFAPGPAPTGPMTFGPVGQPYRDPPFDLRPHDLRSLPADVHFHPSVQACLDGYAAYAPANLAPFLQGRRLDSALLAD